MNSQPPQCDSGKTFSIRSLFALMFFSAVIFAVSIHWKLVSIGLALFILGCLLFHKHQRTPFALMACIGAHLIALGLAIAILDTMVFRVAD